jgi:hypothetical protein
MPRIVFDQFDGLFPRLSNKLLPERAAVTAANCRFNAGHVEPLKGPGASVATVTNNAATLYRWRRSDASSAWLAFATRTDIVRAPVHEDAFSRLYYTTAAGAFRLKAWKDAAEDDRAVGVTAPAALTATTAEGLNEALLLAMSSSATVTLTVTSQLPITGQGWTTGVATTQITGLGMYRAEIDGAFVRLRFPVAGAAYSPAYYAGSLQHIRLGASSVASAILVSGVSIEAGATVNVTDGGATVATLHYVRQFASGFAVTSKEYYQQRNVHGVPQQTVIHAFTSAHELVLEFRLEMASAFDHDRDVYYLQTHVDALGQESPPSPLSELVHVPAGSKVTLAAASGTPTGGTRRIYRTATGSTAETDDFYLAYEGTGAWVDTLPDEELAEPMPRIEAPPALMYGLCDVGGGVLAAYKGREVYFSEPWLPFSWPTKYRLTMADDVVAIAHAGSDTYVLLRSDVTALTGADPGNYATYEMRLEQGCVAASSVGAYGGTVFYASPDGIMELVGGQGRLISDGHFSRREWQALTPSSMRLAVQDGTLLLWHTGGGLVFNLQAGVMDALATFAVSATAAWRDAVDDALYLVQGTAVTAWGAGDALTLAWRSREFALPREVAWSCVRIVADAYPQSPATPLTLKVYREGTLAHTMTVTSERMARLPRLNPARVWGFELGGTVGVDLLAVATEAGELRK